MGLVDGARQIEYANDLRSFYANEPTIIQWTKRRLIGFSISKLEINKQ